MKRLSRPSIFLSVLALSMPGCVLWDKVRPLTGDEERMLAQYEGNARQYYEGGQYERAIQQAQRALELDSGNETARLVLAWSHLQRDTRDDVWNAEPIFRKLSGGFFSKENREAVLGHGFALRRQGDFLAAAAERAAKESPPSTVERLREQAGEKYEEATGRLKRAYALDPEATDALAALQQIYALQGNYAESIRYGEQYVAAAAKSWPFWEKQILRTDISAEEERVVRARYESSRRKEIASRSLLASCQFKQEKYPLALTELDTVLQLDPDRVEEYFNRALCREKIGELIGAVQDMETFLKKTPLGFESSQVRKAYDSISRWNGLLGRAPAESGMK